MSLTFGKPLNIEKKMCFLIEIYHIILSFMVGYIFLGFILFTNMYDAQTSKIIKYALISCPTIKQFEVTSILPSYLLCNFVM
jgi:hypothetical protein